MIGLESDALDTPAALHVDSNRMRVLTACVERGTGGAASPDIGISTASADPKKGRRRNPYLVATLGQYHGILLEREGHRRYLPQQSWPRGDTKMKVLGASLLLFALWSIAEPSGADPFYGGTFNADQPFTITLDYAAIPSKTTVTVIYYLTTGRPTTKFDVHVVPAGARLSFLQVIPRGTRLIAIELAVPMLSTANAEVAQVGNLSFPLNCVGGCTVTFDVP